MRVAARERALITNNNNNTRRADGGKGEGGERSQRGGGRDGKGEVQGTLGRSWNALTRHDAFPLSILWSGGGRAGERGKLRKLFGEVFMVKTLIFNQKRDTENTYITSG